ncbi:MAG TPA: ATP-dependent sacrificial sulfur transferase LarE [Holophagaceae bacterium]|nr:ATP-dependent sacrificial sulfur transferase LarE [Holophagaceae bacterium]
MLDAATLESRLLESVRAGVAGREAFVCFSGGVDSTLVLAACLRAGVKTTALLAVSPSLAREERAEAHALAGELGAALEEMETHETDLAGYRANAGDRCYFCKSTLYGVAERAAAGRAKDGVLLNGTQVEDLGDVRPGLKAASEHEVLSPLVEAGFRKAEVRALARHWGLSNADKAAAPCLASRFPVGVEVTPERLKQVEQVESFLREKGLWPARARWHEHVVRLEIDTSRMALALAEPLRSELERACWRAGFRFAAVDLGGIQSGSLARTLETTDAR